MVSRIGSAAVRFGVGAAAAVATCMGSAVAAGQPGSADTGSGILGDIIGSGSSSGSSGSGSGGSGSAGGGSSDSGSSGSGLPGGGVQQCNNSTKSGGAGVTTTVHQLGVAGPTSFVLAYETYDIPDRIQVFYENAQIHDTGYVGDNANQGTGSAVVTVPAGGATSVTVRVTGPSRTKWEYTVRCPR
ncbi:MULTISPECIES: hypothetical protein [Nocardia]|uniref:hypothetical protein n=1 Tax=Nocardia TaxID=1817 RepID=UPI001892D47C|nr:MULTISPECIES: hypothetical protein [Nocardia]MBF6177758.1 hypothetical protein [Nocardia otitidiscaviarum]